jgi:hypothetical protein
MKKRSPEFQKRAKLHKGVDMVMRKKEWVAAEENGNRRARGSD